MWQLSERRIVQSIARCRHKIQLSTSTLAMIGILMLAAPPAVATPVTFNIPPRDLASALIAFSKQSGIQVTLSPELVEGHRAPRVAGAMEPAAALQQLIGPTLAYEFIDASSVVIRPVEAAPTPPSAPGSIVSPGPEIAPPPEDIVVTGTRIRGVAPAGAQVITIDRSTIDQTGYSSTDQLLQSLPQNVATGASEANTRGAGSADMNADYGTGVNLRGLGTASTLVLVNGHRVAAGGSGSFVDVSTIPLSAIERVEVLPDGASALYGSDAVGGVVNIVLRKDFDGAETSVRYGGAEGTDKVQLDQLWGTSWDGGNLLLSYEYSKRGALAARDRDYYTADLVPFGGSDLRLPYSNPGNIIAGNGSYAIPPGQNGQGLSPGALIPGKINLLDQDLGSDILPEQTQNSIVTSLHQDLGSSADLFAEGYFTERDFRTLGGAYVGPINVPRSNPFFVSPVPGAQSVSVEYSFLNDMGNLINSGRVFDYTGTIGANIDLPYGWRSQLSGSYSVDDEQDFAGNQVNTALLQAALADPNPATAFNPFGAGSNTNPATINAIRGYINDYVKTAIRSVDGTAEGPVFDLPGGAVRLAVGAEYRDETLNEEGSTFLNTAQLQANTPSNLGRQIQAVYGELYVPIVGAANSLPGVEGLNLSLAGRFEHYSDFGSTSNPKYGVTWSPVSGLSLRGSYGTSFQAPLLSQLDTSANQYFLYPLPDPSSPTGRTETLIYTGGGSANLKPQTAKSWTLGADLQPDALPGFKASVDYFDIDYTNLINTLGGNIVSVLAEQNIYAPLITRNPSSSFLESIFNSRQFFGLPVAPSSVGAFIDANPVNLGELQERGLDISAAYQMKTGFGTISLQTNATYTLNYKVAVSKSSPPIDMVSTLNSPVDLRMRSGIGWSDAGLEAAAFLNYVDGYKNTAVVPAQGVDPWTTVDLHFAYKPDGPPWLHGTTVALDVQNLFNATPPFVNNPAAYGYDPVNANVLGRFIGLQVSKKW
jgi:iron complex outermembrane recepter protein